MNHSNLSSTWVERNIQKSHTYLKIMYIDKHFEKALPKNVVLVKTKSLTFLDKMQFSAILRLETYSRFCADRSQLKFGL